MLRYAWTNRETAFRILEPELGMPYWGTPGQYVREGYLRKFVEQVGHLPALESVNTAENDPPANAELTESLTSQVIDNTQKKDMDYVECESDDDADADADEEEDFDKYLSSLSKLSPRAGLALILQKIIYTKY